MRLRQQLNDMMMPISHWPTTQTSEFIVHAVGIQKGCLCRDKKPELELIPAPLVDHLHSMIELLMTNIRKKLSKVWAISIHQYG